MKWRVLIALAAAELLGLTLWFSASAITPALVAQWRLDESLAAWLTMSVQLGFVAGTLLSALLNLPDILNARHLFAVCAFLGALANGAIGLFYSEFIEGGLGEEKEQDQEPIPKRVRRMCGVWI